MHTGFGGLGPDVDIAIFDATFGAPDPATVQDFVEGGGAVMTTIIGFGGAPDDECDEPNAIIEPLGIAYDCNVAPPWGDELTLTDHPAVSGVDVADIPFVNGRWVVDAGAGSVPVVLHGDLEEKCSAPPPPKAAQCNTVGRTTHVGCGRVFVYGDEHVRFESNWPGTAGFWDNSAAWLADGDCFEDRTHIWAADYLPDPIQDQLAGAGFALSSGLPDPATLGPDDIVIGGTFSAEEIAAAHEWIDGGGALMTMIAGIGDAAPEECDAPNAVLEPLGLSYDCSVSAPWGPVTSFAAHPIADGLDPLDLDFVNGRWVRDEDGTSSVVAYVDPDGECTDPE